MDKNRLRTNVTFFIKENVDRLRDTNGAKWDDDSVKHARHANKVRLLWPEICVVKANLT